MERQPLHQPVDMDLIRARAVLAGDVMLADYARRRAPKTPTDFERVTRAEAKRARRAAKMQGASPSP